MGFPLMLWEETVDTALLALGYIKKKRLSEILHISVIDFKKQLLSPTFEPIETYLLS